MLHITRRHMLALPATMLAAPVQPERFGVLCQLGATADNARKVIDAARDAGFRRVMVNFNWRTAEPALFDGLPRWLEDAGLTCDALGAYVNCVDPSVVIMSTSAADFARAIDYAGALRCSRLVAWTGSHTPDLMKSDPRNDTRESEDAILRFLEPHLNRLANAKLTLALETYITLTCPDAPSLARLLRRLPPFVGAVMDPPNLTPIASYPRRDQAMKQMFSDLRGRIAVVHLKDFRLKAGGDAYDLPGPLAGEMNYPLYAQLIKTLPAGVPVAAEHIGPGEFKTVREKLSSLFTSGPRDAALEWFRSARLGLFIHYGLYSLDGVHAFHQHRQRIPVREYEKRAAQFTATRFDASAIVAMARDAGMRYINFVTKHCEGFCLWNTKQTPFNSVKSAAKRDLVGEMANACDKAGLKLFLFYEHGFDWRHPHGPRRSMFPVALTEVPYDPPEPTYAYGDKYDMQRYVDYVSAQITELLTGYGPIAGIWLDGAAVPASGPKEKFRLPELYDLIHRLQPQCLVSYKWGITGAEDFLAPEELQLKRLPERPTKPIELCVPLNPGWGYVAGEPHHDVEWALARYAAARELGANLLLNIGPLGDGSVHPEDVVTVREFGRRVRKR